MQGRCTCRGWKGWMIYYMLHVAGENGSFQLAGHSACYPCHPDLLSHRNNPRSQISSRLTTHRVTTHSYALHVCMMKVHVCHMSSGHCCTPVHVCEYLIHVQTRHVPCRRPWRPIAIVFCGRDWATTDHLKATDTYTYTRSARKVTSERAHRSVCELLKSLGRYVEVL